MSFKSCRKEGLNSSRRFPRYHLHKNGGQMTDGQYRTIEREISSCFSILTCIVDEDVQSGFSLEEVLGKEANRLETCQIQVHEQHLVVPTVLDDTKVLG